MNFVELKIAMSAAEAKLGLDKVDLSTRELLYIVADHNLRNTRVNVTSLTNMGKGTNPTVISRVNKLANAGWIERIDDPDDQRSFQLRITPKAQSAINKMSRMISAERTP